MCAVACRAIGSWPCSMRDGRRSLPANRWAICARAPRQRGVAGRAVLLERRAYSSSAARRSEARRAHPTPRPGVPTVQRDSDGGVAPGSRPGSAAGVEARPAAPPAAKAAANGRSSSSHAVSYTWRGGTQGVDASGCREQCRRSQQSAQRKR